MSGQGGQRFRRRAVRRGYKVDEVDTFLDRVEATLNGVPGAHVSSQEVHDVVFRVRFGGYDEWQVDLHLDRVERQLAELEERSKGPGRGEALRATERPGPVPPVGGPQQPPLPSRPVPQPQRFEPEPTFGGYDGGPVGVGGGPGFDPGRHGKADMTTEMRMPPPPPPGAFERPPSAPPGGFDRPPQAPQGFQAPPPPSRDSYGPGPEFERPAPPPPGNTYGSPVTPPPAYGGAPQGGFTSPAAAAMTGPGAADVQRVDQMRRTFQLRRFGSGYDPTQVDRLFEGVIGALAGQPGAPIGDNELDPAQFSLVPGGYYEAEVDAALREVRDIVRRH
ncbi:DivIVA domain-containing protein [Hamadaea flava]|uniref:Cell wall synthesis protein Wag31 n=1 Tax=Hamadaea flava TaxID=1742688 RepID=A0ABV8LKU9_9ACTN|nr:DivIVA domain-containing protein [Hamadaea flava]